MHKKKYLSTGAQLLSCEDALELNIHVDKTAYAKQISLFSIFGQCSRLRSFRQSIANPWQYRLWHNVARQGKVAGNNMECRV